MPVSKAQQRATAKYKKSNYDRIEIVVPKGRKAIVQEHAAARSESVNSFINRAITETMDRDSVPKEVIFGRAVDTLAEWYEASPWDVLDQLKGLKAQDTPTPGDIGGTTPATSDGQE